jgi:hypothetical protein
MSGFEFHSQFGMLTPEGDEAVGNIINLARALNLSWPETYKLMKWTADMRPGVAEIMDTVVREVIYHETGAYQRAEDFFV